MTHRDILVTGGAGFIGRNMIRGLLDDGYTITSLDNYKIGGWEHVPASLRDHVEWVEGDTRDLELLTKTVRGKDAVLHLAAPSSFLMYEEDPVDGASVTTHGFLNVLEAMRRGDVGKLVYASTSAVYEGNPVPYTEGMELAPPDLKALSKKWNEEVARQYSERYGMTAIGMRPFSVYGHDEFSKGGYANVISLFVWAVLHDVTPVVWGDGRQTRDFIYVEDAGRAFQRALECELPTQEFNVGTGVETTFSEVLAMIGEELGRPVAPRYVDVPIAIYAERLWADITRARDVLGFRHRIDVREGVRRVIEAARAARTSPRWNTLGAAQMYFETLPRG
ncbi:NAD-dependent epimerase/dehydratase family protein [Streptomyces yaizuensis]|uniref:NAD-dependent epimerase/dehydratase family protein n=1 Tax=Streptomyces yaizuensis TaxID=2989713 RepID=A0ABQ5P2N4_9ACTN|nr:NAD-dependent epimerase/dehydratase family protein [Streptomyces sp. YSPA8]GLF96869.1 NAD-dependent epimerase/dehydratase family protein [Streptomyces sp. YSPA8]